jgi:hypothetical protein
VRVVLRKWERVMERKRAYRRFQELTKQAMAPILPGRSGEPAEAISIRLSPEVRRALEERAAAEGTTPSEIVQDALRRHL